MLVIASRLDYNININPLCEYEFHRVKQNKIFNWHYILIDREFYMYEFLMVFCERFSKRLFTYYSLPI